MNPERVVALALLLLVAFGGGCGMMRGKPLPTVYAPIGQQERRFAEALQRLKGGKDREAQTLFEEVIAGQPLPGVTDEALFRLALLHLQDEDGEDDAQARALLARLKKEYPRSIWTQQAAPLVAYLDRGGALRESQKALNAQWEHSQSQLHESRRELKGLREELKTLRERSHSLLHDNKELQNRLERLKDLDLELEQRIKR